MMTFPPTSAVGECWDGNSCHQEYDSCDCLTPLNQKTILKNGVIEDFFLAVGKEKMDTLYPSSDIQMDIKYPAFLSALWELFTNSPRQEYQAC